MNRTRSGPTASSTSGSYSSTRECVIEEAGTLGDRAGEGVQPRSTARREVDGEANGGFAGPREEIAQARQVEVMVRVHVSDHDTRQVSRIENGFETADDAQPGIEQDGCLAPLDEISGAGRRGIGECRAATEHGQAKAARHGCHAAHRTVPDAFRFARG